MGQDRKMEQNSYEDLMREMVGKDAYFLFVFDRLIASVSPFPLLTLFFIDIKVYDWSVLKRRAISKSSAVQATERKF